MKKTLLPLFSIVLFLFVGVAYANTNPPSRVARLSYFSGQVSFAPAALKKWAFPALNRPLTVGDWLWSGADGKAELQLGGAVIRLGGKTSLGVVKLDDQLAQFKLDQGVLNVRVGTIGARQAYEVDTPNMALYIRKSGDYRIDVDRSSTIVSVRSGRAEIYGVRAVATVSARQSCRFVGTNLQGYQCFPLMIPDSFDRWSAERDRRQRVSISTRYVSPEIIGYEDLDSHGTWRFVRGYGNVWMPNRVAPGWAPYRFGRWVFIQPWGWTWVDNEPWGFAPFHYGRWVNVSGVWYWVPGRMRTKPVYSPALVAFVGGRSNSGAIVGWFPLGPEEVYRPSYRVSREYFIEINRGTTLSDTYIVKQYNSPQVVTNVTYVNRAVPNAMSVVQTSTFAQSKPVEQAIVPVAQQSLAKEPIKTAPPVAPVLQNPPAPANTVPPVQGAAAPAAPQNPPANVVAPAVPQKPTENQPAQQIAPKVEDVMKPLIEGQKGAEQVKQPELPKPPEKAAEKPVAAAPEKSLEKPVAPPLPLPALEKPVDKPAHEMKPPAGNKVVPEVKSPVEKPIVEHKPAAAPEIKPPVEEPAVEHKPQAPEMKPLAEKSSEVEKRQEHHRENPPVIVEKPPVHEPPHEAPKEFKHEPKEEPQKEEPKHERQEEQHREEPPRMEEQAPVVQSDQPVNMEQPPAQVEAPPAEGPHLEQ